MQGSQEQRRTRVKELLPSQLSEDSNKRKQGGQKRTQGESATSLQNAGCEKYPSGAVFLRLQRVQKPTPFLHAPKFRTAQDSAPCHPFFLFKGRCAKCGKEVKATISDGYRTGYGPNFTAFVGTMSAFLGCTRRPLLDFLTKSGYFHTEEDEPVPLSLGGLNKLLERCSQALKRPWERIREVARPAPINYVDETS